MRFVPQRIGLEERLRGRGGDREEVIARRMRERSSVIGRVLIPVFSALNSARRPIEP